MTLKCQIRRAVVGFRHGYADWLLYRGLGKRRDGAAPNASSAWTLSAVTLIDAGAADSMRSLTRFCILEGVLSWSPLTC